MCVLHMKARYLFPPTSIDSNLNNVETEFVLSREVVIAQQEYISGRIGSPTTIIQFQQGENGEYDRIDSQVSSIALRTSCDMLRRCINDNGRLCRDCDAMHAELFMNTSR